MNRRRGEWEKGRMGERAIGGMDVYKRTILIRKTAFIFT